MLVYARAAIAACVIVPVLLLGLGAGDVAAFNTRASSLEQSWSADERAGVSHTQLVAARTTLQDERDQKILGFLPFSIFSGALFFDPFKLAESAAARGHAQAVVANRQRAEAALAQLKQTGGPNYDARGPSAQLAVARQPGDLLRLATLWEAQARELGGIRDQLSQAAGGMTDDGMPKDVADGAGRLQTAISAATQANLSTDPGPAALGHAQTYLKQPYPVMLQQHGDIAGELKAAADRVQHRVDTRALADGSVGQFADLLSQAAKYSITGSYPARTSQVSAQVQAAEAARDDAQMDTAASAAKALADELSGAVATARQKAWDAAVNGVDTTSCIPGAPAQLIVIHLAVQQLVAYNNGCPFLHTPITSGRPAVRTDTGTFHIAAKFPSYKMISPWPAGNPLWYPTTVVYNAMEFNPSDGSFIHSADWQPPSTFGAGSENGPYASHGCVHVQDAPLAQLYNWASVGTTVMIS
jgi:lipoprotein-anchoring transpeptidase ErfK/SrfK